ncbi:MAG: acyl-CoA dehydrogenase C-terminal domain-containing protein, partial [Streptosporangiaceae bacterium]
LKNERQALRTALTDVQKMVETMLGWQRAAQEQPSELYRIGQNTTRLLLSVGDLVIGYLLLRQAGVALTALDDGSAETDFYTGKVAVARFFAATVLPELTNRLQVLANTDNALMDIPDGAFG